MEKFLNSAVSEADVDASPVADVLSKESCPANWVARHPGTRGNPQKQRRHTRKRPDPYAILSMMHSFQLKTLQIISVHIRIFTSFLHDAN